MAETNVFRSKQAVNFHLPGDARLLSFIADYLESELSKAFYMTVSSPGDGTPNLVQLTPKGGTSGLDAEYLEILDASLRGGFLREWNHCAERLPRLELVVGLPG